MSNETLFTVYITFGRFDVNPNPHSVELVERLKHILEQTTNTSVLEPCIRALDEKLIRSVDLFIAIWDGPSKRLEEEIVGRCMSRRPFRIFAFRTAEVPHRISSTIKDFRRPLENSTHRSDQDRHHALAKEMPDPIIVDHSFQVVDVVVPWMRETASFAKSLVSQI